MKLDEILRCQCHFAAEWRLSGHFEMPKISGDLGRSGYTDSDQRPGTVEFIPIWYEKPAQNRWGKHWNTQFITISVGFSVFYLFGCCCTQNDFVALGAWTFWEVGRRSDDLTTCAWKGWEDSCQEILVGWTILICSHVQICFSIDIYWMVEGLTCVKQSLKWIYTPPKNHGSSSPKNDPHPGPPILNHSSPGDVGSFLTELAKDLVVQLDDDTQGWLNHQLLHCEHLFFEKNKTSKNFHLRGVTLFPLAAQ